MKASTIILTCVCGSILLTGCAIKPLGFFQVDPYFKPLETKINRPLNIVLLEGVADNLIVDCIGIKEMKVTAFRRSVEESMRSSLENVFLSVNFMNARPDTGLTLVVYRIKPFWKINSQASSASGFGEYTYSTTTSLVSAAFQFETSLFIDNHKIRNADATVYSEEQMYDKTQAHPVFKKGLQQVCETINKEIFQDEVIVKISEY